AVYLPRAGRAFADGRVCRRGGTRGSFISHVNRHRIVTFPRRTRSVETMSIVLQNLHKQYGAHTVVDHVSLEIHDGELLVLLGPSGSGKSTILRIIAGLVPADSGRVWLHGKDVTDQTPQQRNTGFVFQNYSLFGHMTVADT